MKKSYCYWKVVVPGTHNYPGHDGLLQFKHRHLFHISVRAEISHHDRELEYLEERDILAGYLRDTFEEEKLGGFDFSGSSCEHIADRLLEFYCSQEKYNGRGMRVSVFEDGENGSMVCEE